MNLGELKFQNILFNSQTQLNHDWFGQQTENESFDKILKNKTMDRSEQDPNKTYKGFTNVTMNRSVGVGFKEKVGVDFEARRSDDKTLKTLIRDEIAHKKLQKTVSQEEAPLKLPKEEDAKLQTIEDAIASIEKELKEALGLESEEIDLSMLAEQLGVDLQVLMKFFSELSQGQVNEEAVEEIAQVLTKENVEAFVEHVKLVLKDQPKETLVKFQEVLASLDKVEMPEAVKIELQKLVETMSDKTKISEGESSHPQKNVENTDVINETKATKQEGPKELTNEASKDVKPVEVKVDNPSNKAENQQNQQGGEAKAMSLPETEVKSMTGDKTLTYEDQVNLMKSESSLIASKAEVKVPLAKHVMNQIVQGTRMSVQLTDQGSELLINLNPKNLGNVALKMAFDKGNLIAQIQVENQTVKGIIESNLDQLKNALKESGYNIGDLDVSVNKENTGQQERSFQQTFSKVKVIDSFEEEQEKAMLGNIVNQKNIDYFA